MADNIATANGNLLDNEEVFGAMPLSKVANLARGAQLGMGLQAVHLDAATPLVFTPAVGIVLRTPTMYDYNPKIGRMMKAIMECQAKQVTGIDVGYNLEKSETPVGHDGQQMHVPTKTKRKQPTPSFVFQEVTGNLIWNMFRQWMWDIQHPDISAAFLRNDDVPAYTSSAISMSMLWIQFDPTMRTENIIDCVLLTNMLPDETGDLGMERNIAQGQIRERTINFTCIAQHNDYVREVGAKIADELDFTRVNYSSQRPAREVIDQKIVESGIMNEVNRAEQAFNSGAVGNEDTGADPDPMNT
jgi:hypothetical protein